MLQKRADPAHRARVIAANNIVNSVFIVAQSLVLMALLHWQVSIPQIFLILGVCNAIVSAYIYTLLPEFFLRFCVYLLAHLCYRLKSFGLENIPRTGPAVLVCNHVTFVDWFLIAADVQRPIRFVMDMQFANIKFLKAVFKDAKVIPIASARRNPEIKAQAFERIAEELEAGALVCIFPEGQLTPDGQLGEFKNGIISILERNPVPVIPMALGGLWGSFFSRKGGRAMKHFRGFWHRVSLVVGPPVPPEEVDLETLRLRVLELTHAADLKLQERQF
jgi:1-acyl-sn-glycerol-3-phosphate acyltransferase